LGFFFLLLLPPCSPNLCDGPWFFAFSQISPPILFPFAACPSPTSFLYGLEVQLPFRMKFRCNAPLKPETPQILVSSSTLSLGFFPLVSQYPLGSLSYVPCTARLGASVAFMTLVLYLVLVGVSSFVCPCIPIR